MSISTLRVAPALVGLALCALWAAPSLAGYDDYYKKKAQNLIEGQDNNNAQNPFVQPQDPALAGGGRDQTLQDGDVLLGTRRRDTIIGSLGIDVLAGGRSNDILIGGTEHFNPNNRDRAFGGSGKDTFIWAPGDGSDFFDGGSGRDTLVLGLIGELEPGSDQPVFRVSTDQQAGIVYLDDRNLPRVDVSGSPGFCTVIDPHTSDDAKSALRALDLDHLVRFTIRGIAEDFEDGVQETDNGLRVTIHLRNVEYLVCTAPEGGAVEVLDLRVSPPRPIGERELRSLGLDRFVF